MKINRILSVVGIIILMTVGAITLAIQLDQKNSQDKLTISASFYPLAQFAQQVGGELVLVETITPPGTEPHDFEPTARDIALLQSVKLFLYNGSGLDPWADRIEAELERNGVTTVRMSDAITLREGSDLDDQHAEDMDEQDSHESSTDPHFWLDPVNAQQEVTLIADKLSIVDPENAATYQRNAASYIAQLQALDVAYRNGLAACANREIITSHAAFGYIAARYNLSVHAIAGLSPDQEPSAQQLSEIAKLAQEKQIHYVFFETLASPRLAETLAREIGAQVLVFNPLEGLTSDEIDSGKTYISVMQDNLQQLRKALDCN